MQHTFTINLTRGKHALVDERDWHALRKTRWQAAKWGNTFYAIRSVGGRKKKETVYMHRQILGLRLGDGKNVDHLNHEGCDNRRRNLRVCTHRENHENRRVRRSLPTGVYYEPLVNKKNPFIARVSLKNRSAYVGCFPTVDAARAARMEFLRENETEAPTADRK